MPATSRVPRSCVFLQGRDAILPEQPPCSTLARLLLPPFAKYAKDGAPDILIVEWRSDRLERLATRRSLNDHLVKKNRTSAIPSAKVKPYPNVSTGVTFFPHLRIRAPTVESTNPAMIGLINKLMP